MFEELRRIKLDGAELPTELAAVFEPTEITNDMFDLRGSGQVPWELIEKGALTIRLVGRMPLRSGAIAKACFRALRLFGIAPRAGLFAKAGSEGINLALKYVPGGDHGEVSDAG